MRCWKNWRSHVTYKYDILSMMHVFMQLWTYMHWCMHVWSINLCMNGCMHYACISACSTLGVFFQGYGLSRTQYLKGFRYSTCLALTFQMRVDKLFSFLFAYNFIVEPIRFCRAVQRTAWRFVMFGRTLSRVVKLQGLCVVPFHHVGLHWSWCFCEAL